MRPTLYEHACVDAALPALAADQDFRAALPDDMCWAVHEVLSYSDEYADVPRGAAMLRWSWDGLQAPAPST